MSLHWGCLHKHTQDTKRKLDNIIYSNSFAIYIRYAHLRCLVLCSTRCVINSRALRTSSAEERRKETPENASVRVTAILPSVSWKISIVNNVSCRGASTHHHIRYVSDTTDDASKTSHRIGSCFSELRLVYSGGCLSIVGSMYVKIAHPSSYW